MDTHFFLFKTIFSYQHLYLQFHWLCKNQIWKIQLVVVKIILTIEAKLTTQKLTEYVNKILGIKKKNKKYSKCWGFGIQDVWPSYITFFDFTIRNTNLSSWVFKIRWVLFLKLYQQIRIRVLIYILYQGRNFKLNNYITKVNCWSSSNVASTELFIFQN